MVVAVATVELIIGESAHQHVAAGSASEPVVALLPVDFICAVVAMKHIVPCAADEIVVTAPTQEHVVADPAREPIVSLAAVEGVIAVAADQRIIARTAKHAVGVGPAGERVDSSLAEGVRREMREILKRIVTVAARKLHRAGLRLRERGFVAAVGSLQLYMNGTIRRNGDDGRIVAGRALDDDGGRNIVETDLVRSE